MTIVEARYAGGELTVDHRAMYDADQGVVVVDYPGGDVLLLPAEARALAVALRGAAEAAEKTRVVRRPADVDDHLREVDGL